MSIPEIQTTIKWERGNDPFLNGSYSRGHMWIFDGGIYVRASSSPHIVPLPHSDENAVDPEEAFIVSLSSCHMLWFLSIASKRGFRVNAYRDTAIGEISKDERGKLIVSVVRLRPFVEWVGNSPSNLLVTELHHEAHEECFIANSVRTLVVTEPIF